LLLLLFAYKSKISTYKISQQKHRFVYKLYWFCCCAYQKQKSLFFLLCLSLGLGPHARDSIHNWRTVYSYSSQRRIGHCGNAAIATRLFFENARFFLRMRGIFKIFLKNLRLFQVIWGFLKISFLFEDIFREIKAFFN
jgi:hypothetical protein